MNIETLVKLTSGINFLAIDLPLEIKDNYRTYKLDVRAKHSLNKTLDTDFIAVYRDVEEYARGQWEADKLDWSGENVYLVTRRNKVLHLVNSEWSSFAKVSK